MPARRASSALADANAPRLVELGRIVKRHGVRGEVRLLLHNPQSTSVFQQREVVLRRPDGTAEPYRVVSARRHKQFALLMLEGVASADAAEAVVGATVSVPRECLPPLEPAAVYHVDLIGCAVRTTGGEELGIVREVMVTGSNDVCVVVGAGREYLIPLVADVIADLQPGAYIVVRPLAGLLDA